MAGITTAMLATYKRDIMMAIHNHTITTGHVFKCALIKPTPTGTYDQTSTQYSDITGNSDEITGTGYSSGGFAWTAAQNISPALTSNVATTSWSVNPSWTGATISARGCMIYNSSASNKGTSVHDFGGTQSVTSGTLTLVLPTNDNTNAILRIA